MGVAWSALNPLFCDRHVHCVFDHVRLEPQWFHYARDVPAVPVRRQHHVLGYVRVDELCPRVHHCGFVFALKGQGALFGVSGSEAIVLACQLCLLASCRRFGYATVPRSSYLAFNLAAGLPVPDHVLLHGLGVDAFGALSILQ